MSKTAELPLVFISYRRADTESEASRLAEKLADKLKRGEIFQDRMDIDGGESWPKAIRDGLNRASVVLVLVGSKWLSEQDQLGRQRIAKPDDWVRQELAIALKRRPKTLVLQILVKDGQEPIPKEALEHIPDILEFANVQGTKLRNDDWDNDFSEILRLLEPYGFEQNKPTTKEEGADAQDVAFAPPAKRLFVGRDENITALERLIEEESARRGGQRAIALWGMGGIGKTALANELVRRISGRYQRVILEKRPPEGHPKEAVSLFRDWAEKMGIAVERQYSSDEMRSHLAEHYDSMLVLIDDAWYGDIKELNTIINALPANATILITTREKNVCTSDINAEIYEVKPMLRKDAILLIKELMITDICMDSKAAISNAEAALVEHADILGEFIDKVGGVPLAIQIAIGSCSTLPEIKDVVARLSASLERGVDSFRTAAVAVAGRNESLAVSLNLSYDDLLADDLLEGTDIASRFRALGVLPEGCILDGDFILSIWGDDDPDDLDGFYARKSLVDRCLLSADGITGEYSVQKLLRAFASKLLKENPAELQEVRHRYHRVVVQRVQDYFSVNPKTWSATDLFYPHLAHVLPQLTESIEKTAGTTLDLLAMPKPAAGKPIERLLRDGLEDVRLGKGLSEGFRHAASRRPEWGDTGIKLLKLGLLCARTDRDHNEEAEFLGRLGSRYTARDPELAEKYFAAALDVARKNNSASLGDILTFSAESRRKRSNWPGAFEHATEALLLHRGTAEQREADTLKILGEVLWRMSQLDEAEAQYESALKIYKRLKNEKGQADILNKMASVQFVRGGRYEQAIELFEMALKKHEDLKDLSMKAEDLNDMGACYRYLGKHKKAEGLFREALELNQTIGDRRLQAINICNIAGALLAQKQPDLAQSKAEEGRRLGEEIDDKVPQLWGLVWEGLAWQAQDEFETALDRLEKGVDLARGMGNPRGLAGALGRLGLLLWDDLDREAEGRPLIEEAQKILQAHDLKATFTNITIDELEKRLQ